MIPDFIRAIKNIYIYDKKGVILLSKTRAKYLINKLVFFYIVNGF